MDFIIDHKRFKKVFHLNELDKYLWSDKRISKFPHYLEKYFQFFNDYAKKNYKLIPNKCLCHHSNDLLLSKTDRHCVEFYTVVCKNCGLVSAYNDDVHIHLCKVCNNRTNFALVKIPYACKLLMQELQTMNIIPRMITE